MKKCYLILITMLSTLMLLSACSKPADEVATISANPDSDYIKTFKDLNLGILFDFNLRLPQADQRWVTLWVERYEDGELDTKPALELSYGESPESLVEGHVGMGLLKSAADSPLLFLYSPSASISPSDITIDNSSGTPSTWDYAISEENIELELGRTQILAVYRQSNNNTIRTYDLQSEADLEQMLQASSTALILKIKIEESLPVN